MLELATRTHPLLIAGRIVTRRCIAVVVLVVVVAVVVRAIPVVAPVTITVAVVVGPRDAALIEAIAITQVHAVFARVGPAVLAPAIIVGVTVIVVAVVAIVLRQSETAEYSDRGDCQQDRLHLLHGSSCRTSPAAPRPSPGSRR